MNIGTETVNRRDTENAQLRGERFWNEVNSTRFNRNTFLDRSKRMRLRILLATTLSAALVAVGQQASTTNSSNNTTEAPIKKTAGESASQNCADVEPLRKQVAQLKGELTLVKRRLADLEKDRLVTTLQEQLEKEEQRGEALQQHLFEISEKEGPLATRMDQINQQLSPEVIDRTMAGVGSLHPEQAREEVKKRLTNEKNRVQSQLDLLKQDQRRTQASLATNDVAIQRLKQKLLEAQRP